MPEKTVGVAVDFSPCSRAALKWAIENVLKKEDNLIVVCVQTNIDYEYGEVQLWEATGSPMIPLSDFVDPATFKKYGVKADPEILDLLETAAKQKGASIVVKIYWGDPREKICAAVQDIPLECLVVGNRGLGKLKRAILGSVSNYVVREASCPVTVVKLPESRT
uniref:TSA: Wollemia nobilis Ref_Wollemi_Transcript_4633_939 transcribed RNA sequence n=1 Tax=Wollemia nobilis TaxID=56998 RepID=A0A0C9RPT1_9CONI